MRYELLELAMSDRAADGNAIELAARERLAFLRRLPRPSTPMHRASMLIKLRLELLDC